MNKLVYLIFFKGGNNVGYIVVIGENVYDFYFLFSGIVNKKCIVVIGLYKICIKKVYLKEVLVFWDILILGIIL